jgi:hypothetical protein
MPSSNKTDLTRGYPIALAAAVILSTTAIFIRYLTQTYHLPALVLAVWPSPCSRSWDCCAQLCCGWSESTCPILPSMA